MSSQKYLLNLKVSPRNSYQTSGETARLNCGAFASADSSSLYKPGSEDLRFTWSKQDGSLSGGSDINANLLTLFNLHERDSGSYVCEVEDASTGVRYSGSAYLRVTASASDATAPSPGKPLSISVTPKEANLLQGQSAEFNCQVEGGSSPSIVWKRVGSGGALNRGRHEQQDSRLVITAALPDDRGYFECEATSGAESVRDYVRVDVEAREEPKLEIFPQERQVELDQGGTFYAQCRVMAGVPRPSIEWSRIDKQPFSSRVSITQVTCNKKLGSQPIFREKMPAKKFLGSAKSFFLINEKCD